MSRLKQIVSIVAMAFLFGTLILDAPSVRAQGANFSSGSTGADGAFAPTENVTLPARTYHFTTINIPQNVTVRFERSTGNPPVILLATGDVIINGVISVSGEDGQANGRGGYGGPAGFSGGAGAVGTQTTRGTAGEGPGGGGGGFALEPATTPTTLLGGGGGYASPGDPGNVTSSAPDGRAYGTPFLQPLYGGSGGGGGGLPVPQDSSFSIVTCYTCGGGNGGPIYFSTQPTSTSGGGGGGGGAVLIASSTSITLGANSQIVAKGGAGAVGLGSTANSRGGSGAGGAVRIVAPTVVASATAGIFVSGGNGTYGSQGGWGFIRVEAFNRAGFTPNSLGLAISYGRPGPTALSQASSLKIASIAGISTPAVTYGSFQFNPDVTIPASQQNPVPIVVNATGIPVGTVVTIAVLPEEGQPYRYNLPALTGTEAASSTTGSITMPNGMSIIYAAASVGMTSNGGPVAINGDVIERKEYLARIGGRTEISYVGKSGRRYSEGEFTRSRGAK